VSVLVARIGGMYETPEEIAALQQLLDRSVAGATEHLRSIITSDKALTAQQTVAVLTGMNTLTVATVTARGEPRIGAVDGHFLHGRFVFTTAGGAAKVRHLHARPAVSAAHVVGDDLGVFVHGRAEFLDVDHPDFAAIEAHLIRHYGSSPSSWGDEIAYLRVLPQWMAAYSSQPDKLLPASGR
jgi:hypothetical protein